MRNKIIITGAKGLIGGCLARRMELDGFNVVKVDVYADDDDHHVHLNNLFRWMQWNHEDVEFVFHLGANTNTLESDPRLFDERNLGYSKSLWYACGRHRVPIIYASCASTYGDGRLGFSEELLPSQLNPLNLYSVSKNMFDKFVLQHLHFPPFWYGIKFFNVYGYDENHKGNMASMIYQAYSQIKQFGRVKLFRDGQQQRDFVYVEDVVDVLLWLMRNKPTSGIYNVGTGKCRSFKELIKNVCISLGRDPNFWDSNNIINWIDMPDSIKDKYQYFTEAKMDKLRGVGYDQLFTPIEVGVREYLRKIIPKKWTHGD